MALWLNIITVDVHFGFDNELQSSQFLTPFFRSAHFCPFNLSCARKRKRNFPISIDFECKHKLTFYVRFVLFGSFSFRLFRFLVAFLLIPISFSHSLAASLSHSSAESKGKYTDWDSWTCFCVCDSFLYYIWRFRMFSWMLTCQWLAFVCPLHFIM